MTIEPRWVPDGCPKCHCTTFADIDGGGVRCVHCKADYHLNNRQCATDMDGVEGDTDDHPEWLSTILNVVLGIEDEGDRVYFGSTNDADDLREVAQALEQASHPLRYFKRPDLHRHIADLQKQIKALSRPTDEEPPAADNAAFLSKGIAAIAAERQRQIDEEGWTPEHDAQEHEQTPDLLKAAKCYLSVALNQHFAPDFALSDPPIGWPWDAASWKPKGELRNLERAGALIAAEIDRLANLEQPAAPDVSEDENEAR